ncbi:hypothetical protein, partial, partial [Parasitella parasitica]
MMPVGYTVNSLPRVEWGFPAIHNENSLDEIVVCRQHVRGMPFVQNSTGPNIDDMLLELNYRERSAISHIQIMTRIMRSRSQARAYCGHYEQSGTTWTEHNLKFVQMMYGGLNGSPMMRGIMEPIDVDKVRRVFRILQGLNPRLLQYGDINVEHQEVQYALRKLDELGQISAQQNAWLHNYIMPEVDVDPREGEFNLDDLLLAVDTRDDTEVRYADDPSILKLVFPYLYKNGRGYYSLCDWRVDDAGEDENGIEDAYADLTVAAYTKRMILSVDRRFGRCAEFLFFMLDYIC